MKKILAIAIPAALLALSSPAHAAITFCEGPANTCGGQGDTVHLDGLDNGADNIVNGTVSSGLIGVVATGNENITVSANGGGQGQAWIVADDGTLDYLDIALQGGYFFHHIEFNLNAPNGPHPNWMVTLYGYDASNTQFSQTFTNLKNNSFFDIFADGGDRLTHVQFSSAPTELDGLGQLRIGGVGAFVPEPATWALMIMGFGGAGAMLRRRRAALA